MVGQLLVLVRMRRDDAALLEVDLGQHQSLGGRLRRRFELRLEPLLR